uniref:Putative helicase MAGATAMA 3 n=1 Tax=Anthurium amnicola TaxID=1678845 RepID=A0A1D1XNF7_9ARAE
MAVDKAAPAPSDSLLARFHKIVLGWDYLRLLRESTKKGTREAPASALKSVKDTYRDVEEYLGVFEPLIFEEVKAHIVQAKDEEVTEWQKGAVVSCEDAGGFHMVSVAVLDEFRERVSENDLLLVSREKLGEGATPRTYAFALVEHRGSRETLTLRMFLSGEIKYIDKLEVESSPRLLKILPILKTKESFLWIVKISSLSTIMREYFALHSVSSLPFKDLILSTTEKLKDSNIQDQAWSVPRPLMEFLENSHNESQLGAIHAGLSRKPFILIQGPPGTGKTQTILGLLSAVLHSAPRRVQSKCGLSDPRHMAELPLQDKFYHWTKASPWLSGVNPRDLIFPVDGDDGFFPTTGNELKPEIVSSNRKYRVHVLVCAPSNSALDEIVLRLLQTGIHDENDHAYNPKIVRIGLKPHHSVQAVSMDYLVEQKLATVDRSGVGRHAAAGPMDRDQIRASILDEAAIVFSTLSFSGSALFGRMNRVFDVVIIDEAAQAVEPATLVPLAHGCKQVFLVGDPVQLPATVISSTAEKFGYGTSMFKRFQKAGYPVQMLKTQYRMHPEIRSFPSREFYSESLEDGELVEKQTKRSWHAYRCFGPFSFLDIDGVESQPSGSGSWVNEEEVGFILILYHKLVSQYPELQSSSQLAVISPYRHQVKLLQDRFRVAFGKLSDQFVDINTVDGFQGREKDVVIFSCVRANSGKGIGFVSDFRRMNVGITRARSSVLVVGSASTLIQDEHWSNLVNSAKSRNCYFKVSKPYSSFFSEENVNSMKKQTPIEMQVDKMEQQLAIMESNAVTDVASVNEAEQDGPLEDIDMDGDDGGYEE